MEEDMGPSYRISVNLGRFFDDERALCYMSVQGGRKVCWLQRRLRRLFALPRHVCLCSRGHLLPPDEPLSLLQPDDLVEVIPLSSGCQWLYKKSAKSTKDIVPEDESQKEENVNISPKHTKMKECSHNDQKDLSHDSIFGELNNIKKNNKTHSSKDDIEDKQLSDIEFAEDEDKHLKQVKEQALALLKCFEETKMDSQNVLDMSTEQARPLRVRRRIRRRRPRTAPTNNDQFSSPQPQILQNNESSTSLELHCSNSKCSSPSSGPPASNCATVSLLSSSICLYPDSAPVAVVQNNKVAPRVARLVRPISAVSGI